jgi:predicted KAP-like P-loop ATPase
LAEDIISREDINEAEKILLPKLELLSKVDRETIYFEGLYKIEEEMNKIPKNNRIVVFIDNLDRCSPKTALEVFESTKVFLDLEGFVFIIGLSYDTLIKLISEQYKQIGIGIKGEEYIRKIIQIYINIPKWKSEDISKLIGNLSEKLDPQYKHIFTES